MLLSKDSKDLTELRKDPLVPKTIGVIMSLREGLKPTLDPSYGFRYPQVEQATKLGPLEARKYLEHLRQEGILKGELQDKVLCCPNCNMCNVTFRFKCPNCKGIDLEKKQIMEHITCGYIGERGQFVNSTCPKCKAKIDDNYRLVGYWFECDTCKHRFGEVPLFGTCKDCNISFDHREGAIVSAYVYTLSDEARDFAERKLTFLGNFEAILSKEGIQAKTDVVLSGISGAKHKFDLVFEREGKVMVADVVVAEKKTAADVPIISLFAKKYDIKASRAALIAIPGISENGKRMADGYDIYVVEANNAEEAALKIVNLFKRD